VNNQNNAKQIRLARPDDLPRILELAKMWPENFIPMSISAIEKDFSSFSCAVFQVDTLITAFLIFSVSYYEIEILWAASDRNIKQRWRMLKSVTEWVEKKYYYKCSHRKVIYAKVAAPNATIESVPEFTGQNSKPASWLLRKLGYTISYRLDDFWFKGDHFLLAVKQKHVDS